jgi:parallel beta-helix repeat protein
MVSVNRKMFVVLVATLLMLGMLNTALPVSAAPSVIHVYPSKSIQAAVDAAKAGDKIIVHAGTYHEQVIVSKQLTLQGSNAVIDLDGIDSIGDNTGAIDVHAGGVTVSGFTIRNVPMSSHPHDFPTTWAICFSGSFSESFSGGLIEKNQITSDYGGIGVYGVSNVKVQNNRVTAVIAILTNNAPEVIIRNNAVFAEANGIKMEKSDPWSGSLTGGLIENNQISSGFFGILLDGHSNIEIRNNVVYNAITAICIQDAPNVVIRGNVISAKANVNHADQQVNGIVFGEGCTDTSVKNNLIRSEGFGIWLALSSNIEIRNNIIYSSANAVGGSDASNIAAIGGPVTSNIAIRNNVIYASHWGIAISGPPDAIAPNILITDNVVHGEQQGISVERTANSIIQNNKVYATTGPMWSGIALSGTNNNIAFNSVYGNFLNGIAILQVTGEGLNFDSTGNTVARNTIIGGNVVGDTGIHLFPGTSANSVIHNKISGVDTPISDQGNNIIIP